MALSYMAQITHIVFDLGGVLVELDGQPIKNSWLSEEQDHEQNWQQWLHSPLVQDFDRGKIEPEDFADQLIEALQLQTTKTEFIDWITDWPKDFFPDALELLSSLREQYTLGIFSNITSLHWPRYYNQLKSQNVIQHYFASFEMGLAKPETAAFKHIITQMGVPAEQILFLDDNAVNVNAALSVGLNSKCVNGTRDAKATINGIND